MQITQKKSGHDDGITLVPIDTSIEVNYKRYTKRWEDEHGKHSLRNQIRMSVSFRGEYENKFVLHGLYIDENRQRFVAVEENILLNVNIFPESFSIPNNVALISTMSCK